MKKSYDVIVIGGGHAGVEAANISAQFGADTLLVTNNISKIGELSCNPAIGGIGKGIIVREVDVLGGIIGKIADKAAIHYRVLNSSKGAAVHGPRVQVDRDLYKTHMQQCLLNQKNLSIISAEVVDFIIEENVPRGTFSSIIGGIILNDGKQIKSNSVVLTTGTFLNGIIHIGDFNFPAGRYGEKPTNQLSKFFKTHGFTLGRMKTGTPARLDGHTIDWPSISIQPSDSFPQPMSCSTWNINSSLVSCGIVYTNNNIHDYIRKNINSSAVYSKKISGYGPRYCPSIEDKIVRFKDKNSHQIFLEPEGLSSNMIYPNGISTSLPSYIQYNLIKEIPGLERVKIRQYGYAIEYSYIDPKQLNITLETKKIKGLFLAGQINGTTGYEEAAGQGIVAGMNAVLSLSQKSVIFQRCNSYIGVMIDDLIHKGVVEPYRIFTSRSEYRLSIRFDNAKQRLKQECSTWNNLRKSLFHVEQLEREQTLPHNGSSLSFFKQNYFLDYTFKIKSLFLLAERIYAPYLEKQKKDIEHFIAYEQLKIPSGINYDMISGLSQEIKELLKQHMPQTIGQAYRISGVTPVAITRILCEIKR